MNQGSNTNRIGAIAAFTGTFALFFGTYLHPMNADPNDAFAAFTEYAADTWWVASHLLQLTGMGLLVFSLIVLSKFLSRENGNSIWPQLGQAGAISSLAVAGCLQAVDGIALRNMVLVWSKAPIRDKDTLFHAAFAVRQIEIGLASIASFFLGITVILYGIAILQDRRFPKWTGYLALCGGLTALIAGAIIAYTGFSPLSMIVNMPASFILLTWMIVLGTDLWNRPVNY